MAVESPGYAPDCLMQTSNRIITTVGILLYFCLALQMCAAQEYGNVRLVDGEEPTQGRVEVFNGTSWMTICSYRWTLEHARVVCQQLSMPKATGATVGMRFRPGSGEILAHDLSCTGQETEILNCAVETRDLKCGHSSDAGVICGVWGHAKEFDVRLAGTLSSLEGRVEIFYKGEWGTLCDSRPVSHDYEVRDEDWDIWDAQVVCRQLGYLTAIQYWRNTLPAETSLAAVMTNQRCKGAEGNLGECNASYEVWGCDHFQEAQVVCDTRPKEDKYDIRLVEGPYPNQGFVEVLYAGEWRSVCDNEWDWADADVICRQLKFSMAAFTLNGEEASQAWDVKSEEDMFLNTVRCTGSENNLADCPTSYATRSSCGYAEKAGVVCESKTYPSDDPRGNKGISITTVLKIALIFSACILAIIILGLLWVKCLKKRAGQLLPEATTLETQAQYRMMTAHQSLEDEDKPPPYNDVATDRERADDDGTAKVGPLPLFGHSGDGYLLPGHDNRISGTEV